jgi:hypothetical protein
MTVTNFLLFWGGFENEHQDFFDRQYFKGISRYIVPCQGQKIEIIEKPEKEGPRGHCHEKKGLFLPKQAHHTT